MNGELAQLIAITSHGNVFLSTGIIDDNFYPGNSSFQFCHSVTFHDHSGQVTGKDNRSQLTASNPVEWFRMLRQEGCQHMRLFHTRNKDVPFGPEHKLAGFVGGGGVWLIELIYGDHSLFVNKHWDVVRPDDPDKHIWGVEYHRLVEKMPTEHQRYPIGETRTALGTTLQAIALFARNNNMENWAAWFDKAYSMLHQLEPEDQFYHEDLLPAEHYSLEARQLLFAAAQSWVFGGMGSWNDQAPDDQETYDRLSGELYDAINRSIVASINSYGK
jgi:hypothetical protein